MTYNKPEATKVASLIEAIQSQGIKVRPYLLETPDIPYDATPLAYEADE